MPRKPPQIAEVNAAQLDDVLRRAEGVLDREDYELIKAVLASYAWLADLVENKKTTIARLRKLLFGASTEKTENVVGDSAGGRDGGPSPGGDDGGASPGDDASGASSDPPCAETSAAETSPEEDGSPEGSSAQPDAETSPKPGHGRNGADAYRGGERVDVPHPSLAAGDACPDCGQGTLYDHAPGVVVRIVGQAPLHSRVYELEKLRCGLCGKIFAADLPPGAGGKKYDATAAAMIALLKYGSGLPFNRLQGLQRGLEIPLPASTQWDVVRAFAPALNPALEELLRQAAQGDVLHHDDTTVKILEYMGKRRRQALAEAAAEENAAEENAAKENAAKENAAKENAAEEKADEENGAKENAAEETAAEENGDGVDPARTGLFTSGVVATREGRRIALFFSGRRHAGENLEEVLKHRAEELDKPIQMCDALSRNLSGELKTIVAHCLAHARRQFVDVHDRFPDECRFVLEALKVVYRNDAEARKLELSPQQRLRFHKIKSRPTMDRLHDWLNRQLDEKRVEPNSPLGGAIQYFLKYWKRLTLFLRVPGAPLDNNICERALKMAILHRKNSLFYRSQTGAQVGDLYMSLIHTCRAGDVNPFDYLVALLQHADHVAAHPAAWLPWNYRANLAPAPAP